MGNSRVIWNHETKEANKIARTLIDANRERSWWMIILLPLFLVDTIRYKKDLFLTRKNFLFTRRLAFNAAKEIFRGEHHGTQMRLIEVKTKEILDRQKKGYYTEKVRRKQLHEIELLIEHYLKLLKSDKNSYEEMIRVTYGSKQNYLSFLNKLQKAEQEVLQAAIKTMSKGSKHERLTWFGKVGRAFKQARMEEAEEIFADG
ncbi:MAG: NF038143 family protein [Desulfobacteraceae bacterium]|jgi:hypothetical protein